MKLLLSKASPLKPDQQRKMKQELHANPAMGHAKKGSKALKRKGKLQPQRSRKFANQHIEVESHSYDSNR